MWSQLGALATLAAGTVVLADSTFSPARPPAVPLAVRSPYLNVWLNGPPDTNQTHGYLPGSWPMFWTEAVQGWQGFIRVDGTAYNWMGATTGPDLVEQTGLSYTSTRSTFTLNVDDKVQMEVEFLSPVTADDLQSQSVTSSYLQVSVTSTDGKPHDVQVYADVSGEWASGDVDAIIEWSHARDEGVVYHKFYRQDQQEFTEANDQASWGDWYWATSDTDGATYQIGEDTVVRNQFLTKGNLTDKVDNKFRAINDHWPVFAFSHDLGSVSSDAVSKLFTIGYTVENAINFQRAAGTPEAVPSLWQSYFKEEELVTYFFDDFDKASAAATALDEKIASDSTAAGGQDYLTITSLSVRQAFGALSYTGTKDEPLIFLKEISSGSDCQTVDVIFPTMPIMLYLDPKMLKYLLDPLIMYMESGQYKSQYAIHDLGTYPNALGYAPGEGEMMPLEESGNMAIMMLAYARQANDTAYLKDHWPLIVRWADYLIKDAEAPTDQLSTDDFNGKLANQTNLAIKGILGLYAVSNIAALTGHEANETMYGDTAKTYFGFWETHGLSTNINGPHSELQYDHPTTYGLLYNIYADRLLDFGFIPQSVYDMQSEFYQLINEQYGFALDSRNAYGKVDWQMFAAAVASEQARTMLVGKVAAWINETATYRAFADLYDIKTGEYPDGLQFAARPVVGGTFALLALPS